MSTINGISFQDPRNINLKGGAQGSGVIRWAPEATKWSANPFSTTDYGLYINSAGQLVFSSTGSTTILGAAGAGGVPTWLQIFNGGNTFALAGTTWTIDNTTGNNNVLTLTNTGAGSGHIVQITNAGTGKDINGTSGTWSVTKLGAAAFLSVATATVNGAGAGITIGDSGANVVTIGTNTNTITMAKATTFSSTITVTDGQIAHTSTSNTVAPYLLTNNTATTLGAGVSSLGLMVVRSTTLTTGNALLVQLAEGTLTTGYYFNAWDSVGVASVFKIGTKGATTIAGNAFGTAALTLTAGDLVLSSGKILATAASNAASSFVFTNNTATTATVFAIAGSGVFTGSTTTSFLTITPSGLTTGTAVYLPVAALTTGTAVSVVANAVTSGSGLSITSTSAAYTSGALITGSLTSSSATLATPAGQLLNLSYSITGTALAGTVSPTNTAITVVGTMIQNGAGGTLAPSGSLVDLSIVSTQTAGTLTDSRNVLKITMPAGVTGNAILVNDLGTTHTVASINGTALTSGTVMALTGGGANLTTGIVLDVEMGAATAGTGLKVLTSGIFAGANNVVLISANSATTSAGIVSITATGLTTGTGLLVTAGGANLTTGIVADIAMGAATQGTGLRVLTSGVFAGANNLALFSANAATTTSGIVSITGTGLTSGVALLVTGGGANMTSSGVTLSVNMGAATTGNGIAIVSTGAYTAVAAGTGLLNVTGNSATTTTGLVQISGTGLTSGSALLITGGGAAQLSSGALVKLTSGAATDGTTLLVTATGAYTGTVGVMTVTANSATTGNVVVVNATALTTGQAIKVLGGSVTTGFYVALNDGALNVITIGRNGHITSNQTTAPTIAVTQQNGITAAAITAGSSDVAGNFTTTGTNNNAGTTILTITFNATYTAAPKSVMLTAANASAAGPNPAYISSITATTFVVTIPASASAGATPSWYYQVIA